ncbi:MAG: carbon-nitrogen hydrolase family protein [Ginsengibacter sp.]
MNKTSVKNISAWSMETVRQTNHADVPLLNAGFEESATTPEDWAVTGPVSTMMPAITIDGQIRYSGNYALRMTSKNPNCNGRVAQTINVAGGKTYIFSVSYRSEGIRSANKSILAKITWFKGKENIGYHYLSEKTKGRDDWFLISQKIQALPQATSLEISLEFRWSMGSVWWDDVSIKETAAISPRNVKIGTVYCRPPGGTVENNIKVFSDLLDQAGASKCQIVCLPEGWATFNTGLNMTKTEANTLNGSAAGMLSKKAKQYHMYIIAGLYIWEGDTLYNTGVLFDRQGNKKAIFKKVHLPYSEIAQGAVPGNSYPVIETDFGKIGILVCWDYAFPEPARILALKGAEIIFCPIWGDVRGTDIWKLTARARAVDNGVYFVTSIYDGHSMIVNPAGDILQESNSNNELLTETVDLNFSPDWNWIGNPGLGEWRGVWRRDRRPDSYGALSDVESTDNSLPKGKDNKSKKDLTNKKYTGIKISGN